ncbi:MAG: DUF3667 domain-containing protein [Cytophagales bacterium]|nr:DUF3667 domain-containing protein [Cytophagales bacterium]
MPRSELRQTTEETHSPQAHSAACSNCGEILQPRFAYCPVCGQPTGRPIVPFVSLAKDFVEDYFSFDSKIFRSLYPLLLRPGFLTVEFLRGRRARYIPPLRMYLTISLLAFLLLAVNKPSLTRYHTGAGEITAEELAELQRELAVAPGTPDRVEVEDVLAEAFWDNFFNSLLPKLFFVMVPLAAVILFALYRKTSRYYMEHLIFSLHFHSFVFVLLSGYLLVSSYLLSGKVLVNRVLLTTLLAAVLAYLLAALRRVHRQPGGKTLLKFSVLVGSYTVAFLASLMAVLLINYSMA